MFTNMLAEMRAYGEGFVIADQIPSKLAPEILKNSSPWVAHRLLDSEDRHAIGNCMNLTEPQIRHLNTLPTGQAAVHDERIGSAILVRILPVKGARVAALTDREVRDLARLADPGERAHLRQHAGCRSCASPCDFLTPLEEARGWDRVKGNLTPFFDHLLFGDADGAWTAWNIWRADLRALPGLRLDSDFGVEYCAAGLAAHDWLGVFLENRRTLTPESGLLPADRLQREDAARALGPFLVSWLREPMSTTTLTPTLTPGGRSAFQQAHLQQFVETICTGQPHTRGVWLCERCPARCQMLSFAAPHVIG